MAVERTCSRICLFSRLLSTDYSSNLCRRLNPNVRMFKRDITHRPPLVYSEIIDQESARAVVLQLNMKSREHLLDELQRVKEDSEDNVDSQKVTISGAQLKNVFLFHAIPFVGFGFLDNFIMIVAGEYIDVQLGAVLSISTMAAAALGNLVSDVAGTGLAGYVEMLIGRLGLKTPRLTLSQSAHWKTRWSKTAGQALGVSLGCFVGMIPLLFYDHDNKDDHSTTTQDAQVQTELTTAAVTS